MFKFITPFVLLFCLTACNSESSNPPPEKPSEQKKNQQERVKKLDELNKQF